MKQLECLIRTLFTNERFFFLSRNIMFNFFLFFDFCFLLSFLSFLLFSFFCHIFLYLFLYIFSIILFFTFLFSFPFFRSNPILMILFYSQWFLPFLIFLLIIYVFSSGQIHHFLCFHCLSSVFFFLYIFLVCFYFCSSHERLPVV